MTQTEFKRFDPASKDELEALAKYYDIFDEGNNEGKQISSLQNIFGNPYIF